MNNDTEKGQERATYTLDKTATILGISIETVQGYIKSMFVKLAVNDRTAAVNVGLKRSIIHLED